MFEYLTLVYDSFLLNTATFCRCTVLLAARANGQKLPPLVIFKGKPPTKRLSVKGLDLHYSLKGGMTAEIACEWIKDVIGTQAGKKTLLVWDTCTSHTSKKTCDTAKLCDTEVIYIPDGCTGLVQPADVSWNEPFKGKHVITKLSVMV